MSCRLAAFCFLWAAAVPLAAEEPLRFHKRIESESLAREELLAVELDSEVYESTRQGFADLRVLDGQGRDAPFLLRKSAERRARRVRHLASAATTALRPTEGGGLEIQVRLPKDVPAVEGLVLVTPLADYEQHVRVAGKDEGQDWRPLVADALVFDYSRFMDVRNQEVSLPPNDHRDLRIVIDVVTAEQQSALIELTRKLRDGQERERIERTRIDRRPFRVDRIDMWYHVEEDSSEPKPVERPVAAFEVARDPDRQVTVIDVRTRREPTTSLLIETASRNFSRTAWVEVPQPQGVRTRWRRIGHGTISHLGFRDWQREQLSIEFAEQREDRYRFVIEDGDNPPLQIDGVRIRGTVEQVVFFAEPATEYRLAYGSETLSAPQYDTSAISSVLGEGYRPAIARLGAAQAAGPEEGDAKRFEWRRLLNDPIVWGTAICLAVAVLGISIYRAVLRIGQLPPQ